MLVEIVSSFLCRLLRIDLYCQVILLPVGVLETGNKKALAGTG